MEKTSSEVSEPSVIVKSVARIVFPLAFVYGVYIFVHGHLTPGGGFQGGTIIASSIILIYLGFGRLNIPHSLVTVLESTAALAFIALGCVGILKGGNFLWNAVDLGEPGTLMSAGILAPIYIAIGVKVGTELTSIFNNMRRKAHEY
ncbi:MAG: MnhB domain-containing protein [Candidatus Methanofastidiosia archaeon]|jgi:multicomponent Na+:H+ antiporter subunit B